MAKKVLILGAMMLAGCMTGTESYHGKIVPGLYRGTLVYTGTPPDSQVFFEVYHQDGDFELFQYRLHPPGDTSFNWAQARGQYAESGDTLWLENSEQRERDSSTTAWGNWQADPVTRMAILKSKYFKEYAEGHMVTNIVGGGSSTDSGGYTFYVKFDRVGDENAAITLN